MLKISSSETVEVPKTNHGNSFLIDGAIASMLLTLIYFVIVSVLESVDHAITQFISLSFLMVPLIVSFGVQIALFSYNRQQSKIMRQRPAGAATSGGMSAISMIACCMHHLTEIVALVGLTAVALFFTTYQASFILIGLVSNIVGILTSLIFVQKNKFYRPQGFFAKMMQRNLGKARKLVAIFGVVIVTSSFVLITATNQIAIGNSLATNFSPLPAPSTTPGEDDITLTVKTVSQNGLTVAATPHPFNNGDEVQIVLSLDTHGGNLGFNLINIAILEDDKGTTYLPIEWSGSPPGGHHVSGTLTFPAFEDKPSSIELVIKDMYGADWNFEWALV